MTHIRICSSHANHHHHFLELYSNSVFCVLSLRKKREYISTQLIIQKNKPFVALLKIVNFSFEMQSSRIVEKCAKAINKYIINQNFIAEENTHVYKKEYSFDRRVNDLVDLTFKYLVYLSNTSQYIFAKQCHTHSFSGRGPFFLSRFHSTLLQNMKTCTEGIFDNDDNSSDAAI